MLQKIGASQMEKETKETGYSYAFLVFEAHCNVGKDTFESIKDKNEVLNSGQPKEKPICLGWSSFCRNVSAERPAAWAQPICLLPFRLTTSTKDWSIF